MRFAWEASWMVKIDLPYKNKESIESILLKIYTAKG